MQTLSYSCPFLGQINSSVHLFEFDATLYWKLSLVSFILFMAYQISPFLLVLFLETCKFQIKFISRWKRKCSNPLRVLAISLEFSTLLGFILLWLDTSHDRDLDGRNSTSSYTYFLGWGQVVGLRRNQLIYFTSIC